MTASSVSEAQVVILHISDLHFGAQDEDKVRAVLDVAREHKPDLVCVTGDIVNFPLPNYFKEARLFLETKLAPLCGLNVFVVPGNHDAILGGFGLWMYRKYLGRLTEFSEKVTVKGNVVCVFGIDSTYPSLRHLYNVGKFSKKSRRALEQSVDKLKRALGADGFKKALKVVLLHHHPLPTLASELERMLYLKNSGQFLNMAAELGTDLILHGHQHDPCYYLLNYNRGGNDESMAILSAGTATKRTQSANASDKFLPDSQIHLIKWQKSGTEIECLSYYKENNSFYITRTIPRPALVDPVAKYKVVHNYKVLANGDLVAYEERSLKAKEENGIKEWRIVFGVDHQSPGADLSQLNFKVCRKGTSVPSETYSVVRNDPHSKDIALKLNPPVGIEQETLAWEYTWPGGWRNLITNLVDSGYYVIQRRTDQFKVEVELEDPYRIKDFKVYYGDPSKLVKELHTSDVKKRGFLIEAPTQYSRLWFTIWVDS